MQITTTKGNLDESVLEKRTGGFENEHESTSWVEYWLTGELVHRSAHVTLKRPISAHAVIGGFGG